MLRGFRWGLSLARRGAATGFLTVSFAFTVGGLSHTLSIDDGLNGLSATAALLKLAALAAVAIAVSVPTLAQTCIFIGGHTRFPRLQLSARHNLFWDNTPVLQVFALAFALLYVALNRRIVCLKAPRLLILRRPAHPAQPAEPKGSRKGRAAEAR